MAKPKALAMPSRFTAVGPEPMPPTTAAPQPKNTSAKVPMNSARNLFILSSLSLSLTVSFRARQFASPRRRAPPDLPAFGWRLRKITFDPIFQVLPQAQPGSTAPPPIFLRRRSPPEARPAGRGRGLYRAGRVRG